MHHNWRTNACSKYSTHRLLVSLTFLNVVMDQWFFSSERLTAEIHGLLVWISHKLSTNHEKKSSISKCAITFYGHLFSNFLGILNHLVRTSFVCIVFELVSNQRLNFASRPFSLVSFNAHHMFFNTKWAIDLSDVEMFTFGKFSVCVFVEVDDDVFHCLFFHCLWLTFRWWLHSHNPHTISKGLRKWNTNEISTKNRRRNAHWSWR